MTKILFIKPYIPNAIKGGQPPLGILYLSSAIKEKLGNQVQSSFMDMRLNSFNEEDYFEAVSNSDIIGFSTMIAEAARVIELANELKRKFPKKIVAVGGPWTRNISHKILDDNSSIDWVFEGESEYTFSEAIYRHHHNRSLGDDIKGFSYRTKETLIYNQEQSVVENLDELPFPDWDLVDLDEYARTLNMNHFLRGDRYAPIVSTRGCPYSCSYCHGLFGRTVRYRSIDNFYAEVKYLVEKYQVSEFQIIDDIFNIKKDRVIDFFSRMKSYQKKVYFCFPNAIRGDLLDHEMIDSFADGGVYMFTVSFETASKRLQKLIRKNLDISKTKEMVAYAAKKGIITKGYFMVGFPTETMKEIKETIRLAFWSKLHFAAFFSVIPQNGTDLYKLAREKVPQFNFSSEELSYYGKNSWYRQAYGVNLDSLVRFSILAFYFYPIRTLRIIHVIGLREFIRKGFEGLKLIVLVRDA